MVYWDVIHGTIDFSGEDFANLLTDLMASPEVQRLRHMRLMNFDVPYIQDLASAKRYPHSIGTCYLAFRLVKRSYLEPILARSLVAAALIHDFGIPPYGHLVETMLRKRNPAFSHELLVRQIIYGNYHPANTYHQIQPGRSLRVAPVLADYGIDPELVLSLIAPPKGAGTAISSGIDLDNIDNVHRMAAFLGFPDVRNNLDKLVGSVALDPDMRLVFARDAIPAIERWQELRQIIYTQIIAHPSCVAYNAFLADMVESSIDTDVIREEDWFISDADFEAKLLASNSTRRLALQLITGCEYVLVDYLWFRSTGSPPLKEWASFDLKLRDALGDPPLSSTQYFFWVEAKLVSRSILPLIKDVGSILFGEDSVSVLVSLVSREDLGRLNAERFKRQRSEWRRHVIKTVAEMVGDWPCSVATPENYSDSGGFLHYVPFERQLRLF